MLTEQITEFELRGPGPSGRIFTPITGQFHDKTKIDKANLRLDYYLQLKYCRRQCTLLSLLALNHLQNLTSKFKILSVLGLKLQTKRGLNNLIFSTGFQMIKM